jgi:hypothetical protein
MSAGRSDPQVFASVRLGSAMMLSRDAALPCAPLQQRSAGAAPLASPPPTAGERGAAVRPWCGAPRRVRVVVHGRTHVALRARCWITRGQCAGQSKKVRPHPQKCPGG